MSKRIFRSKAFQHIVGYLVHKTLSFVCYSNKLDKDHQLQLEASEAHEPVIFAIWHGQHFLMPYVYPRHKRKNMVALVSKSKDAEFNAIVLNLAGYDVVRGSGGRIREATLKKGGVSAILELLGFLKTGKNVCVIADISKGEPRESGKGIVTLAKLSGRPIVPLAIATSRFKVIEGSWDKTTINLPFGKSCVRVGNPVFVPGDSSGEELDMLRKQVDAELNNVTREAYEVVGHSI
ncbi:lysophospholipid acyltransferase family protein [Lentilitoribacter sp. Alg239-R112]|uniref:lysophospholipid acyltransferase family protein n=1 Tax=Lentilitoribacter sp. Alg239-R112 TaxID=2305987 RepID=UPI0013A6A12C|nr:lysophospholipid acyltransferase family protein [Lentilitoribacter sp. Alg239-R112]